MVYNYLWYRYNIIEVRQPLQNMIWNKNNDKSSNHHIVRRSKCKLAISMRTKVRETS